MIIIRLTGGLGNQLFQYAAGRARAEKQNTNFKLDISAYKENRKRSYRLQSFSITGEIAHWSEIFFKKYFDTSSYLDGYFQSEKYFKNIQNIIEKEFEPKESVERKFPDIAKRIRESNSVSVHIRRTDYLDKQKTYTILEPKYYKKAMDIISAQVSHPTFFFFSDDIEWVKKNIDTDFYRSVFISDGTYTDIEELSLMSLCKHNIIANSTFSWWGAWLNKHKNKIIIAPRDWYTDTSLFTEDLLPETWLKI